MKGKIEFHVMEDGGVSVSTRLEKVTLIDKFHLIHCMESALEMSETDWRTYVLLGHDMMKNCDEKAVDFEKLFNGID